MKTLYDALCRAAETHGDRPFLCVPPRARRDYLPDGAELTFGQMKETVDRLAAIWSKAGWGRGHRVALAFDNHPLHIAQFLALNSIGAAQVPINPYYLSHELDYLLSHSRSDAVAGLSANAARVTEVSDLPFAVLDDAAGIDGFAAPPAPRTPLEDAPGRDMAIAIIYTSGTTSRPKGVVIDNEYAFAVGRCYAEHNGRLAVRDGEERIFVPLPFFHVNAGVNTITMALLKGVCLIVPDRFHAETWWEDIDATRATAFHYLGIIPPILMKTAPSPRDRAHGLRYGLGAGLDPALHRAFEERFGVPMVEVWGMSETGRFLADCHEPRQIDTRAFGRPMSDHLEAKVVDENDREVSRGSVGELVVRAPGPDPRQGFFVGYLDDEPATEAAWRGGWFHTGDVVTQGQDDMLCFVERNKNIIRRSGENISAAEVENALIECGQVRQVAVIGVTDEMRDEEVFACIVPDADHPATLDTALAILNGVRGRLAYYKVPGWIAFRDSLPVTGTQKVQKHRLYEPGDDPRAAAFDLREAKAGFRRKAS